MKNILGGHITRTSDEIKKFSSKEIVTKMYNSVISYKELETLINEFNNEFLNTTFKNKLAFQLEIAIMKLCSPVERIKWETSMRIPEIMDEIDNDPYTRTIYCILNDFIKEESKKSMERILTIKDVMTPDGKILKDMRVYDYSNLDSHKQYDNYKSILFDVTNHDFIKQYYRDYLYFFPITLAEFERVFFFFLTFLAVKQYPQYTELNDIYNYKREINEILRMRYIDIHDRVIMALIHIINIDPELQLTCKNIYKEIKDIEELTISQVFDITS
jgi:hypothetical protein